MSIPSEQIGHVEILRTRVYPQHADLPDGPEVIVAPGQYPLYRDGKDTFWLMRGWVRTPTVVDMGGGMYAVREGDWPSDVEVDFPSRRFGIDEWADLLRSPEFTEGHKSQRVRVSTLEGAA